MARQIRPPKPSFTMLPMFDGDTPIPRNIEANLQAIFDAQAEVVEAAGLILQEQRAQESDIDGKADASHTHAASDVTSGTFDDARIAESSVTQHEAAIDHDALANFVAAEHIDWSVTGAEDVNVDRIAAGAVTQHEGSIDHDALANYAVGQHRVINDSSTASTVLWSASKINSELGNKPDNFLDLTDTPGAYGSQGTKYVRVNAGETALEFQDFPTVATDFTDLDDTPASYSGEAGKIMVVNSTPDAVEFSTIRASSDAFLMTEKGGDPSTPSTGDWALYFKSGGLYFKDDAGTVYQVQTV